MHWFPKALLWLAGIAVAGALALMLTVAVALAMAYPNLPDVSGWPTTGPSCRCACTPAKAPCWASSARSGAR